uniref:Homeodomain-like protein n=1 Tax=Tanacetum cinerariifolium TaxID=118510 RepID=A0A6L2JYJ8_TANCI|nr:homeodomain-like protein [Tanacetum cinerariifolium]
MEDVDKRVEWLLCEPNFAGDIFGEPQKTTRVGDEYQAQIPSLMTKNDEVKIDDQDHFDFGLSIPVTWVRSQHKKKKKNNKKERKAIEAKGKSGKIGSKRKNCLLALPCSSVEESWSVIEQDCFILGLYVFGKNLRVVNQFMGNKGMPHVISFYYGKFYRSTQHQKLVNEYQEKKNKVFTWDTVGIKLLVEAVAVGKEKQDLTANDKRRSRKKVQSQSFNTEEIISILKERIGLSQERLNEVFWEAVWPRLLANGWHSEQLTTYASKQSLVFLPPDVEKFSKRGLEKGRQYFDSLTEVLYKVASHPHLLGHEPDQDKLVKSHAKQDVMRYTVVDTSLAGLVKVRELTCLQSSGPAADMQASSSVTVETKQVSTEEAQNKDVNHKTAEIHNVANSPDCETSEVNNCQPVRKLKLVFRQKPKEHQVSDIRNDDSRGEDKSLNDPRPEKKRRSIVLGLNNPRVGPYSLVSTEQSVSSATVSNQGELLNGASNGQRHSTRNRPLTMKALESLANGFLDDSETKRKWSDDTTPKRVRAKTALVYSCALLVFPNDQEIMLSRYLLDKNMEDVDKRVEWLHCESHFAGDIFGEPQKTARIGDEYQVQISSLMTKNDEVKTDDQDLFDFGLSIPVTWVRSQHNNKKEEIIRIQAKGKSVKIGSKRKNRSCALPGSSVEESWSVIEQDSFILGLYIFGKNLRVVNKFIGNKGMPNVISFYYGKFYRSVQHQNWSTYVKKRRTKSSPGRKTLRGWRRQELLSRLLPNVSDECKTRLTQSQSFNTEEIINILKDRIGLSQERLNEVFWEAVWPRLLANGWHSEQPTTYASKQSLVFLPPDVEKFSKRGLEKGNQYFDSLNLNKVASHPHLLGPELTMTSWSSHTQNKM